MSPNTDHPATLTIDYGRDTCHQVIDCVGKQVATEEYQPCIEKRLSVEISLSLSENAYEL